MYDRSIAVAEAPVEIEIHQNSAHKACGRYCSEPAQEAGLS